MNSPFPGMDPFLEGTKWPDVHHKLASVISELITPNLAPKYLVSVEIYTIDDSSPGSELGIMYPDVAVLQPPAKVAQAERISSSGSFPAQITPASITMPTLISVSVRIPVVEIRDPENNILITTIEILSPVNKRNPGLEPYRKKRRQLYRANVHLLEIDLLRRGSRPFTHPLIPEAHYYVTLIRAKGETQIWGFNIQDALPIVPLPLKVPDSDITLDLGKALQLVYQRSYYHASIDYSKPPPPPAFSAKDQIWLKKQLATYKKN